MTISAAIDTDILDLSSARAGRVIAALVDNKSRSRSKLADALHVSQADLVREVIALADPSGAASAAVVWVNTYFAENFEDIGVDLLEARSSPKPFYVFAPSAIDPQEQFLCNGIHDNITDNIPSHDVHLSHLLGERHAPEEVEFRLATSEVGESRLVPVGAPSVFTRDQLHGIQWYRDVLFPGAMSTNPERASWVYVHLGLPHRSTLAVRAAGVYLMMRSEEQWRLLRSHLKIAFRTFLSDVLFTHTYQRLRDKQGEATATFADVSHELNALYEKHFRLIPSKLTAPGLEDIAHAWRLTSAMAWLGWLQGKAMASHYKRDRRGVENCKKRFCAPLRTLAERGLLPNALQTVAREVAIREGGSSDQNLECSVVFTGNSVSAPDLSPQEFVVCYLLVAEPVRNHVQHGQGVATWRVDSTPDRMAIVLDAPLLRNLNPVSSITFDNLGAFLRLLSQGDSIGSDATHARQCDHDLWQVTIGRPLFSSD